MSHRIYLYHVNYPGEAADEDLMMVEIGYGLPVFLHPLLVGEGLIGGNNYNIHTPGKNSGLFYPAVTGIENFKRFYNFIEKHQSELIERPEEFTIAKARIFGYLVKLDQDYFNLDAWDVFNTNTESHHEQATDLLEDIRNNNLVITKAMDSADPGHLKLLLFSRDSAPGFENFKEFLNHPDFDYGWGVFDHSEAASDVEIFEENGLWGLKDQKGNLIISPRYEEFYSFNAEGIAVVSFTHRFGYVDKIGMEVIKLQFDDAFDFVLDHAAVVKSGKYGLINQSGVKVIDYLYEDLLFTTINNDVLDRQVYYTAQLDGKWGLIDLKNKLRIPFVHEEQIESNDFGETYTVSIEGKSTKLIYSHCFVFLLEAETSQVNALNRPDWTYLYKVKQDGENMLFNDHGELLLSGYEKIVKDLFFTLVIKKDGKFGLLHYKGEVLLNFEYEKMVGLDLSLEESIQRFDPDIPDEVAEQNSYFFKVQKDKKWALFLSSGDLFRKLTEFIYDDIVALENEFLAVKKDGFWGILDAFGKPFSEIIFDVVITANKAYCCKNDMVYLFDSIKIIEADKEDVRAYIEINEELDYYYFNRKVTARLQAYVDK